MTKGSDRNRWEAPTERDMKAALFRHFAARYAVLTEMTVSLAPRRLADFDGDLAEFRRARLDAVDRRIDVLLWSEKERLAVEIKVTRADLRKDVSDPAKQEAWRMFTHRHAYAVPASLLDMALEIVPANSGVIKVGTTGLISWARRIKKDPKREVLDLPRDVMNRIMYRLASSDAHRSGYGWDPSGADGEDIDALRARVKRLEADYEIQMNKLDRMAAERNYWRSYAANNVRPPCGTCKAPLIPVGRYSKHAPLDGTWKHADALSEEACEKQRTEVAEADREQRREKGEFVSSYLHVPRALPDWEAVVTSENA